MKKRVYALLRQVRSSPLAWILIAAFLLHIVGIGWGMPASDAWEDDGIAPRDFLVGTYETYLPGHFFTYPPVHLLGLSLLTAPAWGVALARAPSFAPSDVISTMIQVPTMTILTLVARFVAELMAIGIIYFLAKLAEEVWGKRASLLVALVIAVNAPLTYYAHTSNLDVPYLFWSCFALLETVRAIVRREPRRFRRVMLLGALAVGTKDQAYAIFLLGFPVAIAAWFALDREARARRGEILRQLFIGLAIAGVLFLLVSGAITNPSGYKARIHFLLGPASQDHAYYAATWAGRYEIVKGIALGFDRFYPWPFAAAALLGLGLHVRGVGDARGARERLVAGLVPLFGALSFVVCFNFTARRTEHRFAMPEMLLLGVYAGVAFDWLIARWQSTAPRRASIALVGALLAWALFVCADVDAMLLLDPRYDMEAWLAANVHDGDSIEIYGANAYLPRLPANARITRVDPSPLSTRNPLPNVVEVQDQFADIESRKPRFVIVPDAWVWRWFMTTPPPGHVLAPLQAEREHDQASRAYFHGLAESTIGYRLGHLSTVASGVWPSYEIHNSTARNIRVFVRVGNEGKAR
jgi:4-amino-4-deoxy-L-arabinose transferase-like glycosyltransferase